jgi:hypothetical protein
MTLFAAGRRFPLLSCYALAAVLGVTLFNCPRAGAVSFQPVSPDELKMTQEPAAPGAAAVILYRQIDRDDNGLTPHEDNYCRIKILTREGLKYAAIEIPFAQGNEKIVQLTARSVKPDGTIVPYDGPVADKPLKGNPRKDMAKTFTLSGVVVGSILEYYYTVDFPEHNLGAGVNAAQVSNVLGPQAAGGHIDTRSSHADDLATKGGRTMAGIGEGGLDFSWILSQELFTKSAKFSLLPYQPANTGSVQIGFTWGTKLLPPGTVGPKQDPNQIVHLEASNVPAFPQEEYMPPADELKSRVDFYYTVGIPEQDVDRYWKKAGKELNGQLEAYVGKKSALEAAVAQIVSAGDSPEIKLRKIYARVQQLGSVSQEAKSEKAAGNAEEMWKQGYGDPVKLNWLYLALVRAAGFEAQAVWVAERDRYFFDAKEKDRAKLNGNLVVVKLNGKEIYCDPGSRFTPFGLLPWPKTGITGLQLDKNGGVWINTPLPASSDSRVERKAQLKLAASSGDLEGKLTVTFTGLEATERRAAAAAQDETARKKALEDEVKREIAAPSELELTNAPDWSDSAASLVAEFKLRIPALVSKGPGQRSFLVGLLGAKEKQLFTSEERVHPVYFAFPVEKADEVTLELPPGWRVVSIPKEQNLNANILKYSLKVEDGKESVRLSRELRINVLMLDTSYYGAFHNFFEAVRTVDQSQVVLQPGAAVAAN